MKYLLIFLLLISCGNKDCRVNPNAIVQTKTESKSDSKSIVDQIRDLRDNLQPSAQIRCNF
jgi:hypothetical protein